MLASEEPQATSSNVDQNTAGHHNQKKDDDDDDGEKVLLSPSSGISAGAKGSISGRGVGDHTSSAAASSSSSRKRRFWGSWDNCCHAYCCTCCSEKIPRFLYTSSGITKVSKYGFGVILILLVAVIWVSASEWIQWIFGNLDFDKPFFMTYFNTAGFALWNLGYLFSPKWRSIPWCHSCTTRTACGNNDIEGPGAREDTANRGVEYVLFEVEAECVSLGCAENNNDDDDDDEEEEDDDEEEEDLDDVSDDTKDDYLEQHHYGHGNNNNNNNNKGKGRGRGNRRIEETIVLSSVSLATVHAPYGSTENHTATSSEQGDKDSPRRVNSSGGNSLRSSPVKKATPAAAAAITSHASSSTALVAEEHNNNNNEIARQDPAVTKRNDEGDSFNGMSVGENRGLSGGDSHSHGESFSSHGLPSEVRPNVPVVLLRKKRIRPYSKFTLLKGAIMFCPLWFLANCLFNYSLKMTSVASNTILSSTSCVWTMILSWIILSSRVDGAHFIAIALAITGGLLIAFSDRSSTSGSTFEGNILALLSAFFYASYTTILKWCLPNEARYSMPMAFGFVGIMNSIMMWPGFIVLHFSGIEPFEWPGWRKLWPLGVNALIGTNLSDVLWAKSVILTSPFVATLGLGLTTPFAMIADAILKHKTFNAKYVFGALSTTGGFVASNLTWAQLKSWGRRGKTACCSASCCCCPTSGTSSTARREVMSEDINVQYR